MISLVYLTTRSPSKLGDELTLAGYQVFEALAIPEVVYLQEHENIDAVVIDAGVRECKGQISTAARNNPPARAVRSDSC